MKIALAPLLLAGIGCAVGPLIPLAEEERARVAAAPAAVLVTVPWKRVRLHEFIYKVLWNEQKVTTYSIDGIWDPAPELERAFEEALKARSGMDAKSLRTSLGEGEAGRLAATRERALKEAVLEGWPESFLHEPSREEFLALRTKGVEYLLEIGLVDILVWRHSWGIYRFQIQVYGRLTRQSDGVVVWFDRGISSVLIEGMNSFADLEKNDLGRMKRHFGEAVKALLAPGHPFLEVFSPGKRIK